MKIFTFTASRVTVFQYVSYKSLKSRPSTAHEQHFNLLGKVPNNDQLRDSKTCPRHLKPG